VNDDHIKNGCHWSLFSFKVQVKHDLDPDTQLNILICCCSQLLTVSQIWDSTIVRNPFKCSFFSFFKCHSTDEYPHTNSVKFAYLVKLFSRSIKSVTSKHTWGDSLLKMGRNLANWFFLKRGFLLENLGSVGFWWFFVKKKTLAISCRKWKQVYALFNFSIFRTQIEIYNLMDISFTFKESTCSPYVRFYPCSSKNHKLDLF
jgi:hypothetical protein